MARVSIDLLFCMALGVLEVYRDKIEVAYTLVTELQQLKE